MHAYIHVHMHVFYWLVFFAVIIRHVLSHTLSAAALSFSLPRCDPKFASAICKFCALTQFEWHYIHILVGSLPLSLFSPFGCLRCCYYHYYYYCCCCVSVAFKLVLLFGCVFLFFVVVGWEGEGEDIATGV